MSRFSDYITTLNPTAHWRLQAKSINTGFDPANTGINITLTNDNKTAEKTGASWSTALTNSPINVGEKVYTEFAIEKTGHIMLGVTKTLRQFDTFLNDSLGDAVLYFNTTTNPPYYYYPGASKTAGITLPQVLQGDQVVGIAVDYDINTFYIYIDNVLVLTTDVVVDLEQEAWGTDDIFFGVSLYNTKIRLKTAYQEFSYTPPVGFIAYQESSDDIVIDETGNYNGTEFNIEDIDYSNSLIEEESSFNVGSSYNLNGTNARIDISSFNIAVDTPTQTIMALITPDEVTNNHRIISGTTELLLKINGDYIHVMVKIGGDWYVVSSAIEVGKRYFALLTYKKDDVIELFVNGVSQGTTALPIGNISSAGETAQIGSRGSLDEFYDGIIQDVTVFPQVLTPTEIEQLQIYFTSLEMGEITEPSLLWTNPNHHFDVKSMFFIGMGAVGNKTLAYSDKTPTQTYYTVKGRVTYDGNNIQNILLRLYNRANGQLLAETKSNFDGTYEFSSKVVGTDKYYVIAFDKTDVPVLNAKIKDYLDPIEIP